MYCIIITFLVHITHFCTASHHLHFLTFLPLHMHHWSPFHSSIIHYIHPSTLPNFQNHHLGCSAFPLSILNLSTALFLHHIHQFTIFNIPSFPTYTLATATHHHSLFSSLYFLLFTLQLLDPSWYLINTLLSFNNLSNHIAPLQQEICYDPIFHTLTSHLQAESCLSLL